jgi:hypothetical protein
VDWISLVLIILGVVFIVLVALIVLGRVPRRALRPRSLYKEEKDKARQSQQAPPGSTYTQSPPTGGYPPSTERQPRSRSNASVGRKRYTPPGSGSPVPSRTPQQTPQVPQALVPPSRSPAGAVPTLPDLFDEARHEEIEKAQETGQVWPAPPPASAEVPPSVTRPTPQAGQYPVESRRPQPGTPEYEEMVRRAMVERLNRTPSPPSPQQAAEAPLTAAEEIWIPSAPQTPLASPAPMDLSTSNDEWQDEEPESPLDSPQAYSKGAWQDDYVAPTEAASADVWPWYGEASAQATQIASDDMAAMESSAPSEREEPFIYDAWPSAAMPAATTDSADLWQDTATADLDRAATTTTYSSVPSQQAEQPSVPSPPKSAPQDDVFFSAYHPKEAAAGKWYTMMIYAYVTEALERVRADVRKHINDMGGEARERTGKRSVRLTEGTRLTIVPEAAGIVFNPPSVTFAWLEDAHRAEFRFRASEDLIGEAARGEVTVYVGPVEVANINLSIEVVDPAQSRVKVIDTSDVEQRTAMYRSIFISYSHQDRSMIERFIPVMKALGHNIYVDYETLRSGEAWKAQLEKLIDEADVFQLFWSHNASTSEAVKREWEYALARSRRRTQGPGTTPLSSATTEAKSAGVGFIRPVYWERPIPGVPVELKHLHFKWVEVRPESN